MLDDITNTYLKYEKNLTDKQKKKLKIEEERLRQTKKSIKEQKNKDIALEQRELDETIKEAELNGLQQELQKIHLENQKEVSDNLLHKMKNLEDMTAEQVANADKRIMLSRFNKASILLEMTSLLALPFVRNKYFFYFKFVSPYKQTVRTAHGNFHLLLFHQNIGTVNVVFYKRC